jgi:hypothetical protein
MELGSDMLAAAGAKLAALLEAADATQLAAFHEDRIDNPSVTVADLVVARLRLLDIVTALEQGTVETMSASGLLDSTLPAIDATLASPIHVSHVVDSETLGSKTEPDMKREVVTSTRPSAGVPRAALDLDKYAVLCAWCEVHPERRESLHRQYGITDEAARAALDTRMETLFVEDVTLRGAFAQRLSMHLKFLRDGK